MKSEEMETGKVYQSKRHMCMNIEGCLRNNKGRKIKIFEDENGNFISDKKAREYLAECQAKGWKVIPIGEPCEGFDYFVGGCPGHLISITESK
jgi:hypothetical protein